MENINKKAAIPVKKGNSSAKLNYLQWSHFPSKACVRSISKMFSAISWKPVARSRVGSAASLVQVAL